MHFKGPSCSSDNILFGDFSSKHSISQTSSPQKILREDSHCGLLENSCDDLSGDEVDNNDTKNPTEGLCDKKVEYFDGANSFVVCHKRKNIFSTDTKRGVEPNETSGSYKNWRVSSSIYSEAEAGDAISNSLLANEDSSRNSADMSGKLIGCLPCTPSPSRAAFAVGGAAKKCAGNLISCKRSNHSSAMSPKKGSSMQCTLNSPMDTSFYNLSGQTDLCCGVVSTNVKRTKASKKL